MGRKGEKRIKKEKKKREKINEKIKEGQFRYFTTQFNKWSCFAKRFSKRFQLHRKSRSNKGARAVCRSGSPAKQTHKLAFEASHTLLMPYL
jgi:hypothetical protein